MATKDHWVLSDKYRSSIKDDYKLGKQLGQPGQFGVANVATRLSDGAKFAAKKILKSKFSHGSAREQMFNDLRNEIEIMQVITHPNIIVQDRVYEDRKNLYIVMELCSGGELFDKISESGQLTEQIAADVIKQILQALDACHQKNIAHCDLKPDNFLFTGPGAGEGTLKMIDFGMAKCMERGQWLKNLVGTPYYTAPEILDEKYGVQSDMWSVGVITFVTLFGFPPFYVDPDNPKEHEEIYKLIKRGFKPIVHKGYGAFFPAAIPVSDDCRSFMKGLLVKDPARRMTTTEALSHPWMSNKNDKAVNPQMLESLRTFKNTCKFRRVLVAAIGHTIGKLTPEQQDELNTNYDNLDKNKDGKVTYDEFSAPLIKSGVEPEVIKEMFAQVDADHSNDISLDELKSAFQSQINCNRDERLYHAFCEFDKDGNGQLSPKELKDVVKKSGLGKGYDVDALLEEADANKDGQISWDEFVKIMGRN